MIKIIKRATGFVLICSAALIVKTNTGGPGWSLTHAPITSTTSESNCTNCHNSFSLQTSGTNHSRINLTNNFTGSGYIPDSSYTLILGYKETGKSKFGFQMTCLESATYKAAGTFTNGDSRSQTGTGVVSGNTRYYIGHTSAGTATVATDSTTWKITWKAPSKNVGNVTFWVTLNVANGTGSSGDYIYSKSFTFSPSTLLPTAKAKITSPRNCSGSNINFGADVTGSPTSYSWSFPSGTPSSSTSSTPAVSYANPGTYRAFLTVKNSKGVSKEDTLSFTVIARPAQPVISPGNTQNICQGDSVSLTASTSSGVTYSWSPGGKTTRSLTVKAAGTYSVVVTSATSGCSSLPSPGVAVNVNAKPQITLVAANDSLCTANQAQFSVKRNNASSDSLSIQGPAGPWVTDSVFTKTIIAGIQTIKAWSKNVKGCFASDSLTVYGQQPVSTLVLSVSYKTLKGFTVSWNAVANAKGYRISIDSGKTYQTPSSGNLGLSHNINTLKGGESLKVRVKALLNDICNETAIAEIEGAADTCKSIPFTVHVDKDRVCALDKFKITLKGVGSLHYSTRLNFSNTYRDTMFNPTLIATSMFRLEVLDSTRLECGYSTKNIIIHEDTVFKPITSFNSDKTISICTNSAVINFPVTAQSQLFQDSVIWYLNGKVDGRGLNHTYNVRTGDKLYANAKNKGGCVASSSESDVVLKALPDARFNYSNSGSIYQLNAFILGDSHTWTSPVIIPSKTNQASADFKDYLGKSVKVFHTVWEKNCNATDSATINVTNLGLEAQRETAVQVYPNPVQDAFTIQTNSDYSGRLWLTNSQGQKVLELKDVKDGMVVKVLGLPSGVYMVTWEGKESSVRFSLTKL
jgi:PKD repeat protein